MVVKIVVQLAIDSLSARQKAPKGNEMPDLDEREERIWDVTFATAWANTEILGALKRQFDGGDGTIMRRRASCERLADDAVNAYRSGRGGLRDYSPSMERHTS